MSASVTTLPVEDGEDADDADDDDEDEGSVHS